MCNTICNWECKSTVVVVVTQHHLIRRYARVTFVAYVSYLELGPPVLDIKKALNARQSEISFDISERTTNTLTRFRRGFLWNFFQNSRLPGI